MVPAVCFVVKELSGDSSKQVKLGFLAGLVPREKSLVFLREFYFVLQEEMYF